MARAWVSSLRCRRAGAVRPDAQGLVEFDEGEGGAGAGALDGAGLDVAGDAEVAGVGLGSHLLELGDGDVVALGLRAGETANQTMTATTSAPAMTNFSGELFWTAMEIVYRGWEPELIVNSE